MSDEPSLAAQPIPATPQQSPDKERAMAHDAVANLAKPGEIDEQPLLEERWDGVVEVCRFGEVPQSFDDFWRVRSRRKEIRDKPKPAGNLTLERSFAVG